MKNPRVSQDAGQRKTFLRHVGLRAVAAIAAGGLLLASAGVVYADQIYNTLEAGVDAEAEVMALNVGGLAGNTSLALFTTDGDGKNGCNLTGQNTLRLSLVSSAPGVATVSPAETTFTSCGFTQPLTITPVTAGSATVTARIISNSTTYTFDVLPAAFRVDVTAPAPSNTAPVLSMAGVTGGAFYAKGSVPTAVCEVTDTEDGPSSFPATLSPITGDDAATGIGSQEATCEYTDAGLLYVKSSVAYNIIDGSAPVISYTLSPATPDGLAGWYRSSVQLTWNVTEADSPSTLVRQGCENKTITLDQLPVDYTCSATSSGGGAGPATVSIKKDGTAPIVEYTSALGTAGNGGWYTSAVEALFTATDATSGLATATQTVPSSGEGTSVTVQSPAFIDIAGNTTAAGANSQTFKIDWTDPEVAYDGATGTAGTDDWYRSNVVATFSATDATSGLASPATQTSTSAGEGTAVLVKSPVFEDVAGNTSDEGAAKATFKIDLTAPTASFDSTLADSYYGSTPAVPTCTPSDGLSGPESCVVSGYKNTVGTHTLTATATDKAGNTGTATHTYTVKAWTLKGFYQPIDMNGVLNTVKGGSAVPAKFEVFAGDTEITDSSGVLFTYAKITCTLLDPVDEIETTATGSTFLRYDTTSGQFIYNWKTPTGAGTCYLLKMTTADGSSISAKFKLK